MKTFHPLLIKEKQPVLSLDRTAGLAQTKPSTDSTAMEPMPVKYTNDHVGAVMEQNKEEGFDSKCDAASSENIVLLPPLSIKDPHVATIMLYFEGYL